jgi:hypothetical protein
MKKKSLKKKSEYAAPEKRVSYFNQTQETKTLYSSSNKILN